MTASIEALWSWCLLNNPGGDFFVKVGGALLIWIILAALDETPPNEPRYQGPLARGLGIYTRRDLIDLCIALVLLPGWLLFIWLCPYADRPGETRAAYIIGSFFGFWFGCGFYFWKVHGRAREYAAASKEVRAQLRQQPLTPRLAKMMVCAIGLGLFEDFLVQDFEFGVAVGFTLIALCVFALAVAVLSATFPVIGGDDELPKQTQLGDAHWATLDEVRTNTCLLEGE